MLFRVVDHYNVELQEEFEPSECTICLELDTRFESKPIKLQSQPLYTLNCCCDGWIHISCLNVWYMVTKSCPICRASIAKYSLVDTLVDTLIKYITYVINFISFIFHICLKIKWSLFLLLMYYVYCLVLATYKNPNDI